MLTVCDYVVIIPLHHMTLKETDVDGLCFELISAGVVMPVKTVLLNETKAIFITLFTFLFRY